MSALEIWHSSRFVLIGTTGFFGSLDIRSFPRFSGEASIRSLLCLAHISETLWRQRVEVIGILEDDKYQTLTEKPRPAIF